MEPSVNELNDKISDIRVSVGQINTKVDFLIIEIKRTAEEANSMAAEALVLSKKNSEDIRDMKATTKWAWGVILTIAGLLVTVGVAVFG